MFFRHRRRPSLFALLILWLGFKFVTKNRLSDEERHECKVKIKTFRCKMREAFSVWDKDEDAAAPEERA